MGCCLTSISGLEKCSTSPLYRLFKIVPTNDINHYFDKLKKNHFALSKLIVNYFKLNDDTIIPLRRFSTVTSSPTIMNIEE